MSAAATARDIAEGHATARGVAAAVRAGTLAPEAVAEAVIARIAAVEPWLRAFACHDPQALRRAAASGAAGPLAGVPFGVKDVIDTADLPTCHGSAAYPADWQPARDAPVVHLVRQAGALIAGKTVTTEFATAAPGPTVNPFDPERTPGGSSSGSAAALAAGLCLMAFGTQTSGSTIRPASYCGVAGMKPSPGLIERHGVKPLASSLDVVGPMARDLRDLALLASVAMRRPEMAVPDAPLPLAPMALFLPAHEPAAETGVAERAASVLGAARQVRPPAWWEALGPAQADVFAWEASAALAPERDLHWDRLAPATHAFLRRQDGITAARWQAGLAARDRALGDLDALFGGAEFLMTQAAPGEAPRGLAATGPAAYNIRWTLLGLPTVTVPAGLGPAGLPVGVQIAGRPGEDARLLRQAAAVEDRLRAAGLEARPRLAGTVPAQV
ncbi:amidase [Poseidonocella sp. HB161398]|uniref:amidase n=1 Tax=Poseidonocella sp. HB161398 TaxID=2320855 RepID=UPI001109DE6B|nr:amidase [Poseidonocella sp. HB161398]